MKRENFHRFNDWVDIGFTALPIGWINVYKLDEGDYYLQPCPGLLLQEATTCTECWNEKDETGVRPIFRDGLELLPRETQTVFASMEPLANYLIPVDGANYIMTTTREEWEVQQAEEEKSKNADPRQTPAAQESTRS